MKDLDKSAGVPKGDGEMDAIQTDQDLGGLLSMDPHIHIIGRACGVLFALDKYLEENRLVERFRPSGKWGKAIGKAVGAWTIKGVKSFAAQIYVRTELQYETDADNPEVIQRALSKVSHEILKEERNQAYEISSEKDDFRQENAFGLSQAW